MTKNPASVVLIEDSPTDLALALHAFKKHNVVTRIQVLRDGAEALEFLFGMGAYAYRDIANTPRVVLLDLKLPLVSGLEVLRQLKADPRTQPIPVVILTGSREEHEIAECYRLGANSYIVKPIDFEQFTEVMRTLGNYWLQLNEPSSVGEPAP